MFASTWIYLSKFSKVIRPMQRKVCQVTLFFCNMIYWIVLGKLTWIKRLRLQKTGEFSCEKKEEMAILHIVTFTTHFNSGWGTCYFTGLIQIRHSLGLLVVQKDDNPLVIAQTLWVCLEHCSEVKYDYWPMKDNQSMHCTYICTTTLSNIHWNSETCFDRSQSLSYFIVKLVRLAVFYTNGTFPHFCAIWYLIRIKP